MQKFAFQPVELGQHLALTAALGQLLFPAVDLQTDGSRDQEYEHQQIRRCRSVARNGHHDTAEYRLVYIRPEQQQIAEQNEHVVPLKPPDTPEPPNQLYDQIQEKRHREIIPDPAQRCDILRRQDKMRRRQHGIQHRIAPHNNRLRQLFVQALQQKQQKTRLQRNHQHQKPICDCPVVICRQQMQHIEILVAQAEQRADNREENILDLALKDRKQQKIHAEQAQRTAKHQGIQIPASAHVVDVLRSGQMHLRQTAAFAVHEIRVLTDHLDRAILAGVNRYEHVVDARLRLRRRRPHLADFEHFTAVYQHARAVIE